MVKRLGFGEFIGTRRRVAAVSGFSFAEIANQPGCTVPPHTHDDAHFVFIARGAYETSARHVESPCGPATLLFNPAGTTHRDHFVTAMGSFVAISIGTERLATMRHL